MTSIAPSSVAFRVADLPQNATKTFDIRPEASENKEISQQLELISLRKLRFQGQIKAMGKTDWRLDGKIGATVIQPCSVTLEPVSTRIDAPIERVFVRQMQMLSEEEIEMPEDDSIEELQEWIDPYAVMIEALSLLVPDYPRAPGAQLRQQNYTQQGHEPMTDEQARPFAGLASLKAQLEQDSD